MKKILIIPMFLPLLSFAQVVISSGTSMATAQDTEIVINTPSDINNGSSFDFSTALVTVELNGAAQSLTGNIVLTTLNINGAGTKTVNNNITVTKELDFTQGFLKPSAASAKFIFKGPADGIKGGDNNSYFDCTAAPFYSDGTDARLYPIGLPTTSVSGNLYTPATLDAITLETGMRVVGSDPGFNLLVDTAELYSVNTDRYWEITPDASNVSNSKVELSLNGLDTYVKKDGSTTIVESDALSSQPTNLGVSSSSDKAVKSKVIVTSKFLAIGKEKIIKVRIHDLITPSGSIGYNDALSIENLDKFEYNHVTLLDRWGVRLKEWTWTIGSSISQNEEFTNYEFSKLGPGNYIVVVEYGDLTGKKMVAQQMVTVLKTN